MATMTARGQRKDRVRRPDPGAGMRIDPDEFERQVEATVGSESGRYRTLFDRAPGAYLVTDASGGIRLANAAAALLLGAPSSLLEGKPLAHYISEEHRGLLRA